FEVKPSIRQLIEGRDWLFQEDAYHIDLSHLSSVAQMSMNLGPCPELDLAREKVEEGLDYFRTKAEEADPETVGTYPAQVLVNLLLRLDRPAEALAVARKYLAG